MAVKVTQDIEKRIDELVQSGEFEDANDVVSTGIKLIHEQKKLDHLRNIIREAETEYSLNGGFEDTDEFWEVLNTEADELVKTGQTIDPDPDVWP